ncbi:hypothetical protein CFC21_110565 [Triticum aestivum]|uniref:Uncharacterized protein n=2 Tax=Triticum aestivum TaxID=4565 RepID=A0A9R1MN57_WHEAT|nr:uncharacterized protein LOC109748583 isoform X2 [Aegilops tauschii subsp. strangulata]XP_044440136.1 uncharacterized protein LOC123166403 [Triticum aestivum]KAF7110461.1 hypothetical protein CFC21_110565 [Triticum aestivum]
MSHLQTGISPLPASLRPLSPRIVASPAPRSPLHPRLARPLLRPWPPALHSSAQRREVADVGVLTGDSDFVIGTDEAKKTDDITELNIAEDFDNRPSKRATPSARAPPASLDLRNPVLCPSLELCLAVLHLRVDVVYSSDLSSDSWIKEMNQIVKFFVRRN